MTPILRPENIEENQDSNYISCSPWESPRKVNRPGQTPRIISLRSLVDKDNGGENTTQPKLTTERIADAMNDYVASNGCISNCQRVYTGSGVGNRWRYSQKKISKIDPYAEEVAEEQKSQEDKSNVDADFEEITEEQFKRSSKRGRFCLWL